MNILTTTGLVQRFVTDWAGPQAVVRKVAIRLGAPCYAGDTLTFTGRAEEVGAVPDGHRGAARPSAPSTWSRSPGGAASVIT